MVEVKLVADGSRELFVDGKYVLVLPGETVTVSEALAAELARNPEWTATSLSSPRADFHEGGTQDTTPSQEPAPGPNFAQNTGG